MKNYILNRTKYKFSKRKYPCQQRNAHNKKPNKSNDCGGKQTKD
jgi:hypothetical protein